MTKRGAEKGRLSTPDGLYRYWIEIRDVQDSSVRALPLKAIKRIHFPTAEARRKSKTENDESDTSVKLQCVIDHEDIVEASDLAELKRLLRDRFPDDRYERTLYREADPQREHALNDLVELLVHAAVENMLAEQTPGSDAK